MDSRVMEEVETGVWRFKWSLEENTHALPRVFGRPHRERAMRCREIWKGVGQHKDVIDAQWQERDAQQAAHVRND